MTDKIWTNIFMVVAFGFLVLAGYLIFNNLDGQLSSIFAAAVAFVGVRIRDILKLSVSSDGVSAEMRQLVDGIRFIERMKANPVDKNQIASEMDGMRKLFLKSIAVREDLAPGTVLTDAHLTMKKPGTGITADRLPEIVGRTLAKPVAAGEFLAEADLEPVAVGAL